MNLSHLHGKVQQIQAASFAASPAADEPGAPCSRDTGKTEDSRVSLCVTLQTKGDGYIMLACQSQLSTNIDFLEPAMALVPELFPSTLYFMNDQLYYWCNTIFFCIN